MLLSDFAPPRRRRRHGDGVANTTDVCKNRLHTCDLTRETAVVRQRCPRIDHQKKTGPATPPSRPENNWVARPAAAVEVFLRSSQGSPAPPATNAAPRAARPFRPGLPHSW